MCPEISDLGTGKDGDRKIVTPFLIPEHLLDA
jgi:hypothetical protein